MTRDMEHGEEIDHAHIIAPFACWWLDIPEPLHILEEVVRCSHLSLLLISTGSEQYACQHKGCKYYVLLHHL